MYCEKSIKLVYIPSYSLDLNPIKEFFAVLKAFIRRNQQSYEDNTEQGFTAFLEWCVDKVGAKQQSAEGHFWHAGLTIEYPHEIFQGVVGYLARDSYSIVDQASYRYGYCSILDTQPATPVITKICFACYSSAITIASPAPSH